MSASPPTWKRNDTYPPYTAFLQQAGGASVVSLVTASAVEFIAHNTGASTTINGVPSQVLVRGYMTIASPAQGMVQYAWGASDTVVADIYQSEYEITWNSASQAMGGVETIPNDSYDLFWILSDLENG
jgi:hypothetical protein